MKTFFFTAPADQLRTPFPFNELILSWNGFRPEKGRWTFYVSLFDSHWSSYVKYAEWGACAQKTFRETHENISSYQDVIYPKSGYATGFRYIVQPEEGASLDTLQRISIFCRDTAQFAQMPPPSLSSVRLENIFPQSQMILSHPRHRDLCSPTATAAAINYLLKKKTVDPLHIAAKAHDSGFDIYGNWILNTAAAFEALNGNYQTFVARASDFQTIHTQLLNGLPVVVSVKGTLPGARISYPHGHLMLVIGYCDETKQLHCMDPAFNSDSETLVSYPLGPFLEAWGNRHNLVYFFELAKTW